MFCSNCGKENTEGVKFCYSCGKSTGQASEAQVNQSQIQPAPAKKNRKGLAIAVASGCAAVLLVVIIIVISSSVPSVGDVIEFGGYEWRVLEVRDGKALILSENIIERRAYHRNWENVTWAESSIRQWLNDDFYRSFTAEERRRIEETRITNADNPWFRTWGGGSTTDKIFLLSLDEVVEYFGDSGELRRGGDNWGFRDEYDSARIAYEMDTAWFWWLRSPGRRSGYAAAVRDDGRVSVAGDNVYVDVGGVRPALWLNP
jgi:hypothetical protein